MNIKQIIAEEVSVLLKEREGAQVMAGLDQLIQILPGTIPELEKAVTASILPYLSSLPKGSLKEADEEPTIDISGPVGVAKEMGGHAAKAGAVGSKVAGYIMSMIPGGKKTGVMIATALDKSQPDHVRNAVLFALANLFAGQMGLDLPDLGHLIQEIPEAMYEMLPLTDDNVEWDWHAFNAVDDAGLLIWAWNKVKKSVDVEEKLHEFGKFIGRSDLGKQPEPATAVAGPGRERTQAAGDVYNPEDDDWIKEGSPTIKTRAVTERKVLKSHFYKIIQEELEVILTNEEVNEIFDLDLGALLDEMMDEGGITGPRSPETEGERQGRIRDLKSGQAASWKRQRAAATAAEEERIAAGGEPRPLRGIAKRRAEKIAAAKAARGEQLHEKDLSAAERRALPDSDFALAGKGEGPKGKQAGSYPIPDEKHARSALSLVSQHGTSEEKAKVRAAVKRKFPGIEQGKD